MRIGSNLRRYRNAKGWSQDVVAQMAGMSQSNYSHIESDAQDVRWEQIETLAAVLETSPENLIRSENITLNIENQHGGNANNYVVQNGIEGESAALRGHIHALEAECQFLRQQVQTLLGLLEQRGQ
jgi:transcriptional regulator with XRE-family HTH domain